MQKESSQPFKRVIFDLESDGLLDGITKIHSLVIKCIDTGQMMSCTNNLVPRKEASTIHPIESFTPGARYNTIWDGLSFLSAADLIVGHNIINYDLPAIRKLHPKWTTKALVRDTIVMARLLIPGDKLRDDDFKADKIPVQLRGRFSLEAFGYRLGNYKGDFKGPWETWTPEMQEYCEQDVEVTYDLWKKLESIAIEWGIDSFDPNPPSGKDAIQLEHDVATIVTRQEMCGFGFDVQAAGELYAHLQGKLTDLEQDLQKEFPPYVHRTPFTPKANNKKLGYVKGHTITREVVIPFNPGSRKQVADRLVALGWKPEEYGKDGVPTLDDDILSAINLPQAKRLAEYFMLQKRVGQLATGREALLRAERKGRVYGRVTTNGAVTGRMTHSKPNMAQLPKVGTPYGKEFRSLMVAAKGKVLVGCDADSLEMRCLGHYMARYDGGAYVHSVTQGKKEDGTDPHTLNCLALGLEPKKFYESVAAMGRDIAKTWFYAFLYGAGDWKLGYTKTGRKGPRQKVSRIGAADRKLFLTGLPAMGKLVKAIKRHIDGYEAAGQRVKGKDYLGGLDGRRVFVRSSHAALNTLLQSAGALLMKRALIFMDADLQSEGFIPGKDYEFVANVHDEVQLEVSPQIVPKVKEILEQSITKAGVFYNFRCPLKGNADHGANWAETH